MTTANTNNTTYPTSSLSRSTRSRSNSARPESFKDKTVTINLEETKAAIIHDKRKPFDRHHHRYPIRTNTMNILDKWLHNRYLLKMKKKNRHLQKSLDTHSVEKRKNTI